MIEKKFKYLDYSLLHRFVETYRPCGYLNINRDDVLILEIEKMMEANNQYFFIGDIMQGRIIFSSQRSLDMIGVEAEELNPYHTISLVHPDELHRNTGGWSKLLSMANDLYYAEKGSSYLSVNMHVKNPKGVYNNILFQDFLFYTSIPYKTVFVLQVMTNIDSFERNQNGYHYFSGKDISYFRYPDKGILETGIPYSNREFEIIRLIERGLQSQEIADELFLSINTVNTHRCNILKKTDKKNISDIIYELKEQGLL